MRTITHMLCATLAILPMCSCSVLDSYQRWVAKTNFGSDFMQLEKDNQWVKYRDAALSSLDIEQYDEAEDNFLKLIATLEAMGVKRPTGGYYEELSKIALTRGQFEKAADYERKYYHYLQVDLQDYRSAKDEASDASHYYRVLGEIDLAQGEWDNAMNNFRQALVFAKQDESNESWPGLTIQQKGETFGKYYTATGDYEKAKECLRTQYDFLLTNPNPIWNIDKVQQDLAVVHYFQGDDAEAEKLFGSSPLLNFKYSWRGAKDIANIKVMLGRIEARRGGAQKALQYWQEALAVLEPVYTQRNPIGFRVEQSDVWNTIGRFQVKQGDAVEAKAAYAEALKLREATGTATHPNAADAMKGLADVAVMQDEFTSATTLASRAQATLDASVVPTHPRTAPTLIALSSLYIMSNQPDQATPLLARIDTILQKPLGPWKEDFMDTAAFYSPLLKKSGKTAGAEHLDQLRVQQKDRR